MLVSFCPIVNCYGNTALHEACEAGLMENGRALLAGGCVSTVAARNHVGSTPLHTLCYGKYASSHSVAFAQLLLDNTGGGVVAEEDVVRARDKHGKTPLLVCCTSNRLDLINLLLEHGADPMVTDEEGRGGYEIAQFYKSGAVEHKFSPVHDAPFSRHVFQFEHDRG
jgi:ankyrin repeat protein